MKKQYRSLDRDATTKSKQNLGLECVLPMAELIQGMHAEIESFSAQLGLQLMRAVMEEESMSRLGRHDGAKALRKAVRDIFGERAMVQRCRIHKRRNVLEHLSREKQRQAAWRLKAAWAESDPDKAQIELRKIVRWLEAISPGAARSLEEGLEETLTVTRLGLHEDLIKTFASTNLIESCFSCTEELTRRVKRWQSGEMFLRWTGAALLFAEKGPPQADAGLSPPPSINYFPQKPNL